jgi:hypothetical protein
VVDLNQIFLVLVENVDLTLDIGAGRLSVDLAGEGGGHVLGPVGLFSVVKEVEVLNFHVARSANEAISF